MNDFLLNLALGFGVVADPYNLLFCFIGVFLGTLVGVLPGLGPLATIAILLPATFSLSPIGAIIMLAGIYYGAQYGGSTTAILINLPGEASSVVTALDGHKMAQQGRAGVALATAAIGSFVAGTVATIFIALLAPPLAQIALLFGPVEYTSLLILGLLGSIAVASGSLLKALGMILLGLLMSTVGIDPDNGVHRFTFGTLNLARGLDIVAIAMAFFGVAEIILNLQSKDAGQRKLAKVTRLMPTRKDAREIAAPIARGTLVGSVLGILPGGGAMLSSFVSYALERRVARDPQAFGRGAIQGVAGPESANNAAAQTSFIPMLTLGVPANAVMALMAGALLIQGIQPGPRILTDQPELFWALIASMWVGNAILLVLNLPLVGLWVRLASISYEIIFLAVLVFCCIGVYSISNSTFDVYLMAFVGVIAVILARLDCEPAPFIIGFLLGPLFEENLRRALVMTNGDLTEFVRSPISAGFLLVAAIGVVVAAIPSISKRRNEVLKDDEA